MTDTGLLKSLVYFIKKYFHVGLDLYEIHIFLVGNRPLLTRIAPPWLETYICLLGHDINATSTDELHI